MTTIENSKYQHVFNHVGHNRDELSIQDGIIYKGCRVLVPQNLIQYMLKRIHASQLGAESNLRMAKDVLFWPSMRSAICYE